VLKLSQVKVLFDATFPRTTVAVTEFQSSTELFSEESCSVIGLSEIYRLVGKGEFSASIRTAGD